MRGSFTYHNPQKAVTLPFNPFYQILRDLEHPQKYDDPSQAKIMHSSSLHQQSILYHSTPKELQEVNKHFELARTASLKINATSDSISMNRSHFFDNKKHDNILIPPLKFTDNFNKGTNKINSAREMGSAKIQSLKPEVYKLDSHHNDLGSQKSSESPTLSPTLQGKGAIQWSLKKKKSKKSDDVGSIKKGFLGEKGFDMIPVENGKPVNIVNVSNSSNNRDRRSSNNQFLKTSKNATVPSPTSESSPSPNSETSKMMKRDLSFKSFTKARKNSHTQYPGQQHTKRTKYYQMPTEPDTPSAQRKLLFRDPVLSDFWIGKLLGKGRFGNVHIVKHKQLGFVCAMKIMSKKTILEQDFINQFCREVVIQMYLKHCNVVAMYGVFDDEENVYLLLQLCLDGQLYKFMKAYKEIPQPQAVSLIKQICDGVEYLHSQNIIHRDLKPQNIIMHESLVKICDFGWAVYNKNKLRDTFCGTPLFLAPEMLKGENYSEKIDNWAIGMISYEMLVGRPAFKIKTQKELQKIVKEEIQFPQSFNISPLAQDFITKLLEKNEEKRIEIEEVISHPFLTDLDRF